MSLSPYNNSKYKLQKLWTETYKNKYKIDILNREESHIHSIMYNEGRSITPLLENYLITPSSFAEVFSVWSYQFEITYENCPEQFLPWMKPYAIFSTSDGFTQQITEGNFSSNWAFLYYELPYTFTKEDTDKYIIRGAIIVVFSQVGDAEIPPYYIDFKIHLMNPYFINEITTKRE